MGTQNFNFAPKFSQNGAFGPRFCAFGREFSDKKKNSDNFPTAKIVEGVKLPPCPPPATKLLTMTTAIYNNDNINKTRSCSRSRV